MHYITAGRAETRGSGVLNFSKKKNRIRITMIAERGQDRAQGMGRDERAPKKKEDREADHIRYERYKREQE